MRIVIAALLISSALSVTTPVPTVTYPTPVMPPSTPTVTYPTPVMPPSGSTWGNSWNNGQWGGNTQQVQDLQRTVTDLQNQLQAARYQLSTAQSQNSSYQQQITTLTSNISATNSNLTKCENALRQANYQLQSYTLGSSAPTTTTTSTSTGLLGSSRDPAPKADAKATRRL